jgi:hypothetical protein
METEYDVSIDTDNEKVELSFGEWMRLCDNSHLKTTKIAARGNTLRYYSHGHNDGGVRAEKVLNETSKGWKGRNEQNE